MAELAGASLYEKYDTLEGTDPMNKDNLKEMYLDNTWRANLSIVGAGGLPDWKVAGNVVRASTALRLSMRLPPNCVPADASKALIKQLTTDVPYNLKVDASVVVEGQGWSMKDLQPWLDTAMRRAGSDFFDGNDTGGYGMGGSIPFLCELEKMYPEACILAFGLIGPKANAHAPNECINLAYAKKLTCSLSHIIADIAAH